MKNRTKFLSIPAIMLILLMGCASAPSSPKQNTDRPEWAENVPKQNTDRPEWAENVPTGEEFIYFVGYAQMNSLAFSMQAAEHRAMAQFSQWKSGVLKVKTVESGETVTTTSSVNAVADVSGIVVIERYIAADGGVYVLMEFPKTDVAAQ
ncbi:hypothetical protein AGMMS50268_00930 [Spirochaetia bacterium]|nr:hypothetical protein AGMMS50268_00930 [Spirochaetia bacterium]